MEEQAKVQDPETVAAGGPVSWKPEVKVGRDEWGSNALRFATEGEALESARELMGRWLIVQDYRATASPDPVNYRWEEGQGFHGNVSLDIEAAKEKSVALDGKEVQG